MKFLYEDDKSNETTITLENLVYEGNIYSYTKDGWFDENQVYICFHNGGNYLMLNITYQFDAMCLMVKFHGH